MSNFVIVYGASGHAKVVSDIIESSKEYKILGYIDDINNNKNSPFFNSKVLGTKTDLLKLKSEQQISNVIIGIGDNEVRAKLYNELKSNGFNFINAIHHSSVIASDVIIGIGNVIVAGTIVNSGSVIKNNVIINTGSTIDHDCEISDSVHISPGVHLAGNVFVGEKTWIGIGSIIKEKVRIGKNSIIGAGSLVLQNIPDNVLAFGTPAKIVKKTND